MEDFIGVENENRGRVVKMCISVSLENFKYSLTDEGSNFGQYRKVKVFHFRFGNGTGYSGTYQTGVDAEEGGKRGDKVGDVHGNPGTRVILEEVYRRKDV